MLASTVQFSRNGPRQPPPPRKGRAGQPAAQRKPAPAGAGSLRTQQRARPAPARPRPVPRPPEGEARTSGRTGEHEVNSQRSTRRHRRRPGDIRPGAAPACSLERR
jgi:hypothetical protein